jgi:hypothetical protein
MSTGTSDNQSTWHRPERRIVLLGLVVSLGTLAIIMILAVYEFPPWRVGFAPLASELASRVGFGLVLAILTLLPYGILYSAASRTRYGQAASSAALVIFLIDTAAHIKLIFFAGSSTEPIGVVFLPLWLTLPAAFTWIILDIRERHPERPSAANNALEQARDE